MISRNTAFALAFACLATVSLAVVAKVQRSETIAPARAAASMIVIDLPRVVVTGRIDRSAAP